MAANTTKIKSTGIICKGNVEKNYEKVPMEVFDYIQLDLISHTDLVVYMKLYQYYNVEIGYAYPTIPQLMFLTNVGGKSTIHKSLKNLEIVGLIQKGKTLKGNNIYVVYKPLDKAELYECVPEKVVKLRERETDLVAMAENDKERFHQHMLDKQNEDKDGN
ncbi:transcriptional regulator [Peribacillus simplex]|uniref:Transcriptional regulator n=1 Tax=Peribacillus simplex TaxID=1478 RepID=A0A8B5XU60_9BACI|nr:helix-turn-helix domain-containing protein [Peribacillus simplex]TVX77812.1 transcriptional regulator [Peribacillus simplex]